MNFIQRISKLLVFSIILSIGYSQSGRDLTGTTVTAEAYRAEGDSHTTVEFTVNVVSPDLNFADGVRFTFAESVNVLDAFVETEMENDPAIVIAGHEVLFGDSSDGVFNGDGIFTNDNEYRFIVHIGAAGQGVLQIGYIVYDDGWAQDFCINDDNCEQCNDYGWGIDCDGNYLTVAMNAEGVIVIDDINIITGPNQDPVIMDLVDVGNDQGKQMILSWHPGDLIDLPYFTEFSVHRYSPDPSELGSVTIGAFYGEYFSSPGSGTSPDFGELMFTREDSLISFNFDQDPPQVYDDFQVRWTGEIYAPVTGLYNFRTYSDDGVRLFVDGVPVVDEWRDYPMTNHYGSIELTEGIHSLVYEYYENGGGAQCYLYWTPPGGTESLVPPAAGGLEISDLGTWDYLSTVPWHGHEPYAVMVNTLEDEVPTAFRVTAHTEDQNVFFHSAPFVGRSYDNIAPPAPEGLTAVVTDTIVSLSWDASNAADFNYYSVHRALHAGFQPNLSNFIGYSATPMFVDESGPWNTNVYYKVSATDMGGNLGPGSGPAAAFIAVNRPPQVFDVAISPAVPQVGDNIVVTYTFFDPDGDQESGTTYEWYNSGTLVPQHTSSTLPAAFTSCTDDWHVVVTPSDGTLPGQPVGSNNVIVCGANTPPVWVDAIPPIHIAEDSYDNTFEMGNLVSDTEQATSQLVFSVAGNTNEATVGATFNGSKLVLSAVSEDFNSNLAATLTLRVNDGEEFSDAYVDVAIDSVNDSPEVVEYVGRSDFDEDGDYLFEIYDFVIEDPDNDAVDMVMSVLPGQNYIRSLESPGLVTTAPNFNGEIVVNIEISDGSNGNTVTAVPMTVNPVNDPAFLITTAANIIQNGAAVEEEEYSLTISWKDPDGTEDASVYDLEIGGPVANWLGVSSVYSSGSGPGLQYNAILIGTPDDINMPENDISISVVDNSEGEAESFIEYFYIATSPVNDAPAIDSYTGPMALEEDGSLVFSANNFAVSDPDNSPIDFSVTVMTGENYSVSSDSVTVLPAPDYNGDLSVGVKVSDGDKSDMAMVSLSVTPVNDALVLSDVSDATATEEMSFSTSVSWTDVDGAGADAYAVNLAGEASNWLAAGAVAHDADSGVYSVLISGTPDDENLYQNDLSVSVTDNSEGEPISLNKYFSVSVDPVNDAPVVISYSGGAQVDEDESFSVSINDFVVEDVDNDFPFDFDFTVSAGDNYTVASDGKSITPAENYNGTLAINLMISDGTVDVPFSMTIDVTPVNDDPFLTAYTGTGVLDEDNSISFSGTDFTVSDPDEGDTEFFVTVLGGDNYNVSESGNILIPQPNFNGTLLVSTSVSDGNGGTSNSIEFNITVNPVNDLPVVSGLAISPAVPDFGDNLVVTYNFSDIDGDTESGTVIQWYKNNELQSGSSSTVSFESTSCDEVWYAVVTPGDGTGSGTASTSNSVTICGENTPPQWTWSAPFRLYEDSSDVVDLYEYMIDNEQAPSQISYTILAQARPDLVTATVDGHELHLVSAIADYTAPNADTLTIKADDGGYQDTVDVVISIAPVNDAPVAVNDAYSIDEGGSVVGASDEGFLANDTDVDGDDLQIVIVDEPINGQVQVNTDWSFSYTHDGSETTSDVFTYMAFDGEYNSNEATVSIAVSPVNDSPVIVYSANFETIEETPFDVVIGDFVIEDPDSDVGSMTLQISDGSNYTTAAITDGYTITPAANFSGELVVPVTVSDGDSTSAVWELFVTVIGGNDAPVVVNAAADISVEEDSDHITISLLGSADLPYFFDSDGDDLSFAAHTSGSDLIAVMVDGDSMHVSFMENAFGDDSVFVSATDLSGESISDTILVSVASVNDAPVILTAGYFVTDEEDSIHVRKNAFVYSDVDNDESELSLVMVDGDGYSIEAITGGYAITPDPDFSDTLYVPSTISDGEASSNMWDLMVVVQPDNDAPVVVNPASDISVEEDSDDIVIALMGSETDPYFADSDGDALDFVVSTNGTGLINISIDSDSLHISFTANMYGSDSVFITATDPSGDHASDAFLVTVVSVNDAPRIVDAVSFETYEDDSLDISIDDFVIRDEDTWDESAFSISISDNDNYNLSATDDGYRLVPHPNFFGDIPMAVTASDGEAVSDTFYTVFSVIAVNDMPEIINPLADIVVDEDAEPMMVSLSGTETAPYFVDVDGDSIEFEIHASGQDIFHLMVDGYDMGLTFMENMYGTDTIYVSGTDGSGGFALDTIVVVVNSVNDIPTAFSLISPEDSAEVIITAASVAQDAMIEIAWSPSTDADGDSIGYGFILFAGQYSVSTPALFAVDVPITALPIPHSAAVSLLETAGYQSITCDWMVFATDGQDTTASAEIRTITIDARPVLSTDELVIPEVFALHQNYPNPFNPTTTIKYDLPEAQNVQVMIYDIMGRKVRTLVNEFQDIGYRTIQWNATDDYGRPVSAGMYVYTIQAGEFRQVKKMVLLK